MSLKDEAKEILEQWTDCWCDYDCNCDFNDTKDALRKLLEAISKNDEKL